MGQVDGENGIDRSIPAPGLRLRPGELALPLVYLVLGVLRVPLLEQGG